MERGLYMAVSGALAAERSLDITADNIANANTAGYKAKTAVFSEVLSATGGDGLSQVAQVKTAVDTAPGVLRETGRALDLAVEGDGFLVVGTDHGLMLSRSERGQVSSDGYLVTVDGFPILDGSGQAISLPTSGELVDVSGGGVVSVGGVESGEIGIVRVDGSQLVAAGSRFVAPNAAVRVAHEGGSVVGGALEYSNTNAVRGMVDVVRASRAFEMLTKMIENFGEIDRRTSELGKR
ncbi:MAG: flagellar hook basal-body protein [Deltaproteobacteria bacterium]|nr:flagellar hook basal-body protein [Deltaproteobacteria bacterium]